MTLPISIYTFEGTTCLADIADLIGGDKANVARQYPVPAIRVHAAAGCGNAFKDVAAILEPTSPNPCLVLYKPLGLNGVQAILDSFKRAQTVKGSDTLTPGQVMRAEKWDALLGQLDQRTKGQAHVTVQFQKDVHGYKVGDVVEGIVRRTPGEWTVDLKDWTTGKEVQRLKHDEVTFSL